MQPPMSDLRAVRAIRMHRDEGIPAAKAHTGTDHPDTSTVKTQRVVRSRLADLFMSVGIRLQHRHAES